MHDIVHELKKHIEGEVRFDKFSRILYSTDASIYEIEPLGVVIPKSTEDIQAAVELAYKYAVPIIPRGGGTSIVGNAIGAGIILDCSKYLNNILEVNREENFAWIQPGVILDQLNQHLQKVNALFGPDVATSSRANLGGMCGNNSSGAHSVVYGKTLDHVLELKVILSNGEQTAFKPLSADAWNNKLGKSGYQNSIYTKFDELIRENKNEIEKRFPKILRRVAGYNLDEFIQNGHHNLAKLIVGSEGTLAVITEAKINLVPLKKGKVLGVIHFKDMFSALEAVSAILEFKPAALELIDDNILDLTRNTMEFARRLTFVEGSPAALLLVEFQGDSQREVVDQLTKLTAYLQKEKIGYNWYQAIENTEQANVWYVRKAGLGLLLGTRVARKPIGFVEDAAVAPEKMPQFIRRFDEIVRTNGTDAAYYAHASVGCLHIRPKINLKDPADIQIMAKIAEEVSSLALEFGGTISGEHGDGLAHSCWNEKMFGRQLYRAFREVKKIFDPKNIMNPGKIVDAQFLTENLRKPAKPELKTIQPFFDYAGDGGFETAIEICNGNGFCRKKGDGTMCPSYMVTFEEEHSTRGRANALRAVLTGKISQEDFTSQRMYDVFDLCIACKGCKGECPTNVDMAKLKYEFLYQYHKANGVPLRDRLFGNVAALSRLGCAFAPLSNWMLKSIPIKGILHAFFGIDYRRQLPPFARQTFPRWFKNHKNGAAETEKKVVLFNDTYMTYNYPQIGISAVEVLESAGYKVILPEKKCCGRPYLSKGMLEQARAHAEYNVEKLYPLVEKGYQIVGCEPSCILTFRDEYPDLLSDSRVQAVAENSFLIEEFLQQQSSPDVSFQPAVKKFLLHGHCHSKALVGVESTVKMLKLIPGVEVEVVDSGCCGMAGAFGYEKEHYPISLAIGRSRLFEAVEAKDENWQIVAAGVSCRQQIEQGTGKQVLHPVEILANHLFVK